MDETSLAFKANEYNMITQNCNHWSEAFTMKLLGKRIPSYINKAARLGVLLSAFLPNSIKEFNPIPMDGGSHNMHNNANNNH